MSLKAMCRVPGGAFRIRALQLIEAETVFGYVHGVGSIASLSPWQQAGFDLAYLEAAAALLRKHWPSVPQGPSLERWLHDDTLEKLEATDFKERLKKLGRILADHNAPQSRTLMLARDMASGKLLYTVRTARDIRDDIIAGAMVNQGEDRVSFAAAARHLNTALRGRAGIDENDVRHSIARFKRRRAPWERQWLMHGAHDSALQVLQSFAQRIAPPGVWRDGERLAEMVMRHPDSARVFYEALEAWQPATQAALAALHKESEACQSRLAALNAEQVSPAA